MSEELMNSTNEVEASNEEKKQEEVINKVDNTSENEKNVAEEQIELEPEEEKKEQNETQLEKEVIAQTDVQPENKTEEQNELPMETVTEKKKEVVESAYGSLENFNWDELDKKGVYYDSKEREKLEEAYTKSFKSIDEQAVIMGTVVSVNTREVVVNIGFKSDGVISASELRYNPDLKVGDEIEVYVESQEDAKGQLLLSHKKARLLKSWNRVNEAHDNQEIITGYVNAELRVV